MNTKSILEKADVAMAEIDKLHDLLHPDDAKKYMEANTHYHLIRDMRDYIAGIGWQDIGGADIEKETQALVKLTHGNWGEMSDIEQHGVRMIVYKFHEYRHALNSPKPENNDGR